MSALACTLPALVTGRVVQGVGAALLTPQSLAILRVTFLSEVERARAIGTWSGVSALGLALGPAIGGPLVTAFGWASAFWINVPVGVAALALGMRVLPHDDGHHGRIDLLGQVVGTAGVAGGVFALIEAPSRGWTSPAGPRQRGARRRRPRSLRPDRAASAATDARRPAVPRPDLRRGGLRRLRGELRHVRRAELPRPLPAVRARLVGRCRGDRVPPLDRRDHDRGAVGEPDGGQVGRSAAPRDRTVAVRDGRGDPLEGRRDLDYPTSGGRSR